MAKPELIIVPTETLRPGSPRFELLQNIRVAVREIGNELAKHPADLSDQQVTELEQAFAELSRATKTLL